MRDRKTYNLICHHCEQPFEAQKEDAKYCSPDCYGDSMRIRQNETERKAEILSKGYYMPVNGSLYPVEHPRVARGLVGASVAVYDVWDGVKVIVGYQKEKPPEKKKHPWLVQKW